MRGLLSALLLLCCAVSAARAALPTDGMKRDASRFALRPAAKSKVWASPSADDYKAMAQFRTKTSAAWQVSYSPRTGAPQVLKGGDNLRYSGAPENAARQFLSDYSGLLKVDSSGLKVSTQIAALGVNHLSFDQYANGLPVFNARVKVHITDAGDIVYYQSDFAADAQKVSATPSVSKEAAAQSAAADCSGKASGNGELVYYPSQSDGLVHLAWKLTAYGADGGKWVYLVDANSGAVLFRYSARITATTGNVRAQVYTLYPSAAGFSDYVERPLRNQYVWVQTPDRVAITDVNGNYSHAFTGRIFASLKGPYFSVVNFRDRSAHYDNGGGLWSSVAVSSGSAHPYLPSRIYSSTITVAAGAVKVMPHFTAGFKVGAMGEYGDFLVNDQLSISHPNGRDLAGYTTWRDNDFFGAAVEGTSYTVTLKASAEGPGDYYGYQIDYSSYLYLTASGPDPVGASFVWSLAQIPAGERCEPNLFYHLNEMRQFYVSGVNGATKPPLSFDFHLPAMAHAHGSPDGSIVGMLNAFYDIDNKNMMFGDGLWDSTVNAYRSFGLDATIIRHEYTHAVHDHIYPMFYFGESGAIMEAMADYWSLSSLRTNDANFTPFTTMFGDFLRTSFGDGVVRNLLASGCSTNSASCKKMGSWVSEVHDDGIILSQALWGLRDVRYNSGATYLGTETFPAAYAANITMPVSDFLIWNALFFFPDTFVQFKDAMEYVARQYYAGNPSQLSNVLSRIEVAFADHDIVNPSGGDAHEPNNGGAVATNASGVSTMTATINPSYDTDYYSVPLPAGKVKITIKRPSAGNEIYHVQLPMVLDMESRVIGEIANPDIANPTLYGTCPDTGLCYSTQEEETLEVEIANPGRHYIVVTAGPNSYYYNCADSSTSPYTLSFDFSMANTADAERIDAVFDGDEIEFFAPYNTYFYSDSSGTTPVWVPSTMTAVVENFSHAQLRDVNMNILPGTLAYPGLAGTYLSVSQTPTRNTDRNAYAGRVKLLPGFASRFPAVGTVYLELFGTVRGSMLTTTNTVVSLGISQALNLTADNSGITVWNNIFNPSRAQKANVLYKATSAGKLTLKIYTVDGMLVKELFSGQVSAGKGNVEWDGRNSEGQTVASGMYYLFAEGPGFNTLKKVVVIH